MSLCYGFMAISTKHDDIRKTSKKKDEVRYKSYETFMKIPYKCLEQSCLNLKTNNWYFTMVCFITVNFVGLSNSFYKSCFQNFLNTF